MGRNIETELQEWMDRHLAETQGYCDIDDFLESLVFCDSSIEWNTKNVEKYTALVGTDPHAQDYIQESSDALAWSIALKKRLEEEIARFPPLPVLPPPEPLVKISGVVEEVTFTKGMICFDAEVYSTVRDELERKRQRDNIGGLVAMTAQALAGSQPHAMFNSGELKKQKSIHVKGKIDGKSFSGWFGMTDIRPGDRVEMAAMPDGDNYLIYAIINVSRGTISVTPQCTIGKSAFPPHLLILFSFLFLLIVFIPAFMGFEFVPTLVVYIATSLAFSAGIHNQIMNRRGPRFALYAQIAEALEFPGGEKFRLLQHSGKISKPKREAGDIQIRKEGDVPVPQGWVNGYSHEFFYYCLLRS
ncbi:putative type VI secretion system effector [Kluyvera sichuanensis]|uniref:putative type VI secretion system effector n=1 Tax=Kluyvera sichuanensis TaxID=2725494 RepID=UPI0039F4AFDE